MMVDGVLVTVTAFSLVLAVVMAILTWRVFRLQQRRAAGVPSGSTAPLSPDARPWPRVEAVTERASALGRTASAPAAPARGSSGPSWADTPIRRTIELKTVNQGHASVPPRAVQAAAAETAPARPSLDRSAGERHPAPVASSPAPRHRWLTAASITGAAVILFALGAAWSITSGHQASADTSPAAARVASPLELVALDYLREGSSPAAIRGLVRNPLNGSSLQQLEAVVVLFDRRGSYVGTTHAPVADGVLSPGTERTFEVPLAAGLDVSQYRVSFRIATAPVPYVDRRPAPLSPPASREQAPPSGRPAHLQPADL